MALLFVLKKIRKCAGLLKLKSVDIFFDWVYDTLYQEMKEAVKMNNNTFFYSYYFFNKGCPSSMIDKD